VPHLWLILLFVNAVPATQPVPSPIEYRHEVREEPRLHLHVVTIDLTDPRVRLAVYPCGGDPDGAGGPWQMTLGTVRETARRQDLDVAVNGNFFAPRGAINVGGRRVPYFGGNWARAIGWLVSDGQVIASDPAAASLVVGADGRVRIGHFARLPADARHVVSGSQQLVTGGELTARGDVRAPRTAAGVSADGTKLVLLVVDGRLLSHSVGMSERELGREMLRLGCADALNLDGGGSSTLVMRDATDPAKLAVVNRPSDGHDLGVPLSIERCVACVLGVRVARDGPTTRPTTASSNAPAIERRP
jgi:hypothetical protein